MGAPDIQELVDLHHGALYRFALGLCGNTDVAADLTQETFFLWASKGHQLRDPTRARSWLFTTLYREFLALNRHSQRHPHYDLESAEAHLPVIESTAVETMDAALVVEALHRVDATYRAPLVLFYLEDLAYRDIAETLGLPIGTVMSRISRGKAQLRLLLRDALAEADGTIVPMPQPMPQRTTRP